MSRRRGEGRKRLAALEAEVAILAGEAEAQRLLIGRLTVDPPRMAQAIATALDAAQRCGDEPGGMVAFLAQAKVPAGASDGADIPLDDRLAADDVLGQIQDAEFSPDGPPTREFTKGEEAAFAEIICGYPDGQS